ncbi:hypothetical protein AZ15_1964 [Bordetella bronchiseptica A1-7]|nr:hypothetical protein AZ15_1964 [Bordetella bronchiseptica A1-7]KDB73088.1 hypothetical protein AZ21_2225 [Bordetella bronchiseptica B20-10725633]
MYPAGHLRVDGRKGCIGHGIYLDGDVAIAREYFAVLLPWRI